MQIPRAHKSSNILTNYALIDALLQAFQATYKTLPLPTLTRQEAKAVLPIGSDDLIKAIYNLPANSQTKQNLTEYKAGQFVATNHSMYAQRFIRVTPELLASFEKLQKQLKKDTGNHLKIVSGYRSPAYQAILLLGGYRRNGYDMTKTLRTYMPPGYSQHGLHESLAVDVGHLYNLDEDFEATASYHWMVTHAATYGFHLSYPDTQSAMIFEPWHWQYLGI